MDKEEFDLMEVKPKAAGHYFVTLYQFKYPAHYIKDWLEYNGSSWLYYKYDKAYVCFIHKKAVDRLIGKEAPAPASNGFCLLCDGRLENGLDKLSA